MFAASPCNPQSDLHLLVGKLRPYLPYLAYAVITANETTQRAADDLLWQGLSGLRGITWMCRNSSVLGRIAEKLDQGNVLAKRQMGQRRAVMWLTLPACAVEDCALRFFADLPLPRPMARFATDHYAGICAEVRVKVENSQGFDVNFFDAVI